MMKQKYEELELEVVLFGAADVITTSGDEDETGTNGDF